MSINKEELIYKYANLQNIIKNQSYKVNEDEIICPICYNLILFPCICNNINLIYVNNVKLNRKIYAQHAKKQNLQILYFTQSY